MKWYKKNSMRYERIEEQIERNGDKRFKWKGKKRNFLKFRAIFIENGGRKIRMIGER